MIPFMPVVVGSITDRVMSEDYEFSFHMYAS